MDNCTQNLLFGSLPRGIQEEILPGWGVQYVADIFFQDVTNFVFQDCKVAPGHRSEVMLRVKWLTLSLLIQYQGLLLTVESTSIGCSVRACCFSLLFSPERGECCTCGVRVRAIYFKASLAHQFAMFVMRETRSRSPSRSRKQSRKVCLEGTTSMRSNRDIGVRKYTTRMGRLGAVGDC